MHPSDPVLRIMTEAVLSIGIDEPAGEVLRQFAAYPVHHMPVLSQGKVVGMLSSADLMKLDAFLPRQGVTPVEYLNRHMRIENMMHKPAITIGARDTVETAASLMARHGIHALPVVNEHERLIGIVTTTDIISAALHAAAPATRDQSAPKGVAAKAGGRADADHARLQALEAVLLAADRYLSAGQDERLHSQLLKAIEHAKRLGPAPLPPAGSMV